MPRSLDDRKRQFAALYVGGANVVRAAAQAGINRKTGRRHLADVGIPQRSLSEIQRRYSCNESFFETISTPEQAWALGLLSADGCVSLPTRGGSPIISLGLKQSDGDAVDTFARLIQTDAPVLRLTTPSKSQPSGFHHVAVLHVRSAKMAADLARLGVSPRKSLTLVPWSGSGELVPHYFRGLVDGDGCIRRYRKYFEVSLAGSRAVVEAFDRWVKRHARTAATVRPHHAIWSVSYAGSALPALVASLLYKDATVYLERKKRLADVLIASC